MSSDPHVTVTSDGESTGIPTATTADVLEQQSSVDGAEEGAVEQQTALATEVNPADALDQRAPASPAEAAPLELPGSLPDDVDPADALDQLRAVGDLDADR